MLWLVIFFKKRLTSKLNVNRNSVKIWIEFCHKSFVDLGSSWGSFPITQFCWLRFRTKTNGVCTAPFIHPLSCCPSSWWLHLLSLLALLFLVTPCPQSCFSPTSTASLIQPPTTAVFSSSQPLFPTTNFN